MKHKVVGKDIVRFDARDKVTGKAHYADDLPLEDFLWGGQVSSPVPRGTLNGIHKDPDFDWSGFVFAGAEDIPGENVEGSVVNDAPLIAEKEIRYAGQPVLLVAHPEKERLHEGLKHIQVDVTPLDHISTIEDALKNDIIVVNEDNVFRRKNLQRGDVSQALKDAKYVFTKTYTTPHQEQMYLEPNGLIAWWEGEKVFIKGSIQCPYYVHTGVKLGMGKEDDNDVVIIQATLGGAFGGKEDYPTVLANHAATLAHKSGKIVKIIYDRTDDINFTTKRHPSKTTVTMGLDKDYKITAFEMDFILDAGSYETMSSVILARGMLHAFGPYELDNVLVRGSLVVTNTPPNGAFRGFGAPQSFFATESHVDYVAKQLGIDPFELRRRNFVKQQGTFPTGQLLGDDVMISEVFEQTLENAHYDELKKEIAAFNAVNTIKKRGFGVSTFFHGAGFTGSGEVRLKSKAGLRINSDGSITILVANTEMGQGAHTVLPQITSEALDLPIDLIRVEEINTSKVPDSGPTVASRTTMIIGEILRRVSGDLKKAIGFSDQTDLMKKLTPYLAAGGDNTFFRNYEKPPRIQWDDENYRGDAYGTYAWATYGAHVEVDLLTGETHVIDFFSVSDIGQVVNPILASGQMEGGILQALGYALSENIVFHKSGKFWNGDFTNYIIPSIMDMPNINVAFLNKPYPEGPYGVKGIGELPMNGGGPAVNNAIRNAVGVDLFNLPLSPEQVLDALEKEGK